jgi:hypothetical protein
MKPLAIISPLALFGVSAQGAPLSTCVEFVTLEQFHLEQIKVSPETGQVFYADNVSVPQLARYMAMLGWMQGQMEAGAWFANGQNMLVGLNAVQVSGTAYDHMTWAFAYCRGYPTAPMPLVATEAFKFFAKR